MRALTVSIIALAIAAAGAEAPAPPAPTPKPTIASNAQDVADMACPIPMLHEYGCPIKQSPDMAAYVKRHEQSAGDERRSVGARI